MNDGLAFPFVMTLAFAMLGVDTGLSLAPRASLSDFFAVNSLTAEREGESAILTVDREIKRPLHMEFSVRVQVRRGTGWVDDCAMSSGVIAYSPDAELPDPVTLDWWTWGECPTLPAGPARIVTTWAPDPPGLEPLTVIAEVEE